MADIAVNDTVKVKEKYVSPSKRDKTYTVQEIKGNTALIDGYWIPMHQLEKVDVGDTGA